MASQATAAGPRRPLRLHPRPDLVADQHTYLGRRYWVVKDPVALHYYRFEEEEYALFQLLDGQTSLEQIRDRFETQFAPQKITLVELQQFFAQLHRSSLVISDAPGQGAQLHERLVQRRRRRASETARSLLSLKVPLYDPQKLLDRLNGPLGWLFSAPAVIAVCLLAAVAGLLVTTEFDVFRQRLPAFHEFFGSGNWLWLAVALSLTKVCHELGHGLSCRRLGGECHELGVMFLVFTPCLYCNVSDSWMLPNKWHRAAIGAAGMYVELLLAAVCTFVFWFTQPGTLHYLCLNVMFVSSVSTLMFNANPLLRYDGYYILSDLLEIPNLRQKASSILQRQAGAWLLGLPADPDPFLPHRRQGLFALFAVASAVYRWVIACSILWFLYHVLEPYGLKSLGMLLAAGSAYGLIVHPCWRLIRFFALPGRTRRVKRWRLGLTVSLAASAVAAALLIPLPHYVRCSVYAQHRDVAAVYAPVPGSVAALAVRPGERVAAQQPLAQLANLDVRIAAFDLDAQRRQLQIRREQLERRALQDERAAREIEEVTKSLASLDDQYQQRTADLERLTLRAPRDGVFLPAAEVPRRPPGDQLGRWSGHPLEDHNRGAVLSDQDPVGFVGDPRAFSAVLVIDQRDIELVALGQPVEILLAARAGTRIRSRLDHVARRPSQFVPASLSTQHGGPLPTSTDTSTGRARPQSTCYQATAPFDDPDELLVAGVTGHARIHVGYRTLATRLLRWFQQTFVF